MKVYIHDTGLDDLACYHVKVINLEHKEYTKTYENHVLIKLRNNLCSMADFQSVT